MADFPELPEGFAAVEGTEEFPELPEGFAPVDAPPAAVPEPTPAEVVRSHLTRKSDEPSFQGATKGGLSALAPGAAPAVSGAGLGGLGQGFDPLSPQHAEGALQALVDVGMAGLGDEAAIAAGGDPELIRYRIEASRAEPSYLPATALAASPLLALGPAGVAAYGAAAGAGEAEEGGKLEGALTGAGLSAATLGAGRGLSRMGKPLQRTAERLAAGKGGALADIGERALRGGLASMIPFGSELAAPMATFVGSTGRQPLLQAALRTGGGAASLFGGLGKAVSPLAGRGSKAAKNILNRNSSRESPMPGTANNVRAWSIQKAGKVPGAAEVISAYAEGPDRGAAEHAKWMNNEDYRKAYMETDD